MLTETLLLILGLVLLAGGADFFVRSSSKIAKKLGISDFIIGLTLVAIGTSIPELANSITSSIKGSSQLIVGNLVGSSILNLSIIIGIAAIFKTIRTSEKMLTRDGYIMFAISALLFIFAFNGTISSVEGLFLLLIYFAYVLFLIQTKNERNQKMPFEEFIIYFFRFRYVSTIRSRAVIFFSKKKPKTAEQKKVTKLFAESLLKDFFVVILGIAAVIIGAHYAITESLFLARALGISERFLGFTILSIGTTLPELSVAIAASRNGLNKIVVGNAIGTNIANIGLIFGISAIIRPVFVSVPSILFLIPGLLVITALLLLIMKKYKNITRTQGIILFASYFVLLLLLFNQN
ncbi:calcium/sodium antiporter [Candidatus Woesearchaeota archaeon]|nr:calcium/sodium antiporter [Candidatus Woesearchaeota archaeon]